METEEVVDYLHFRLILGVCIIELLIKKNGVNNRSKAVNRRLNMKINNNHHNYQVCGL